MTPIPLDPEFVAKLTTNGDCVPFADATGKLIGYFLSTEAYKQMETARYDEAFAAITEEEVQQALADSRRHTSEEVFKLLEGN